MLYLYYTPDVKNLPNIREYNLILKNKNLSVEKQDEPGLGVTSSQPTAQVKSINNPDIMPVWKTAEVADSAATHSYPYFHP